MPRDAQWLEERRQELEWRRCRKDIFYFLQTYWKIRHPERGAILLELRDAQRETLTVWLKEKLSIALKARQIGFSTLAAGLVFWHTFFYEDRFIITLSRTERDAQKLKAKIDYGHQRLPLWMRERGPSTTEKTLSKLAFDNGSSVEALPATDPARGESAYLIIVDEWAFFENAEGAWAAIEPATDIGGRVIALSTANGSGNLFHQMVVGAQTKSNDFKLIFHSWRAVPERDDAWYENKKRNLASWTLHQEYPSSIEEAFIKSGRPVFDVDQLDMIEVDTPRRGYLYAEDESKKKGAFIDNEDGPLHVYARPVSGERYVIGADVAEGLEHGDYSVAHVINIRTHQVVAKWRGHVEPDVFGKETLFRLGHWYNYAFIGGEVNNHGLTTLTHLQAKGYGNLYYRHSYDERTMKRQKKLGWLTTVKTKPLMIDELAASLRMHVGEDQEIIEPAELELRDEGTIGELRTFVRNEKGQTHGSPFDDQVMSLAVANQMLKHRTHRDEAEADEAPEGSFEWWTAQEEDGHLHEPELVIGRHSVRAGATGR